MNLLRVLPFSAASLLLLSIGCGSSPSTATATPTPSAATTIYVVQNDLSTGLSSILEFPANGHGSVTPTATLTAPTDTTFTTFESVSVDQSGDLYVPALNYTPTTINYEVLVYAAGATGAATPTRTLTVQTGYLNSVSSIGVDALGQIYALSENYTSPWPAINVYAPNATGAATPIRQIAGDNTNIHYFLDHYAIDMDGAGNIYLAIEIAGASEIMVFPPTAAGNVMPTRTVIEQFGNLFGHSYTFYSYATTVDATGDIYEMAYDNMGNCEVLEYAPSANGPSVPIRTISFTSQLMPIGIAVDAAGNLYTLMEKPNLQPAVYVFSPGASGSSAPSQTITSTAWATSNFGQIAVH